MTTTANSALAPRAFHVYLLEGKARGANPQTLALIVTDRFDKTDIMRKEELQRLDAILDQRDVPTTQDKILLLTRGYYIYYNRPNRRTKELTIHVHSCGQCSWGSGKITQAEAGRNGVWIGPFTSVDYINKFVQDNFRELVESIENCSSCMPK